MAHRNEQHPFYPFAAGYIFSTNGEGWRYWNLGNLFGNRLAKALRDETMMKYAMKLFDPDKTASFLSWVLQAIWNWPLMALNEANFSKIIGLLVAPEFSTLHVAASLALPSICVHLLETRKVDLNMSCRLGTPLNALLAGVSIYSPYNSASFQYGHLMHYRQHIGGQQADYIEPRQCLEAFIRHHADTSAQWGSVSIFQLAINTAIHADGLWIQPLVTPSTWIDEACINACKTTLHPLYVLGPFFDAIIALGSMPDISPMWVRLAFLVQTYRNEDDENKRSEIPIQIQRNLSDEDFVDAIRISLEQNLTDTVGSLVQDPRFLPNTYIPFDKDALEPILHFAIRAGSPKLLELLFGAGCDPKVVDQADGWTGLHQCACFNEKDAANANLLLRSGVSDSVKDKTGETCWHVAARSGNILVLKALIELGSDAANSLQTTSEGGRTPLATAILHSNIDSALLLLDHCNAVCEVFRSDESLLEEAVAIGSDALFPRLYETMRQAGVKEALQVSKLLDNINMACSPRLLGYLLNTWVTDYKSRSDALVNYLLDVNNPQFKDPDVHPKRVDVDHIVRRLLPSPSVDEIDDHIFSVEFWSTFCDKVLVNLTIFCDHKENECRHLLIDMIFDILIEARVLTSHERNTHLPSYKPLFRSLLERGEELKCSWISSSIEKVIKASDLAKYPANDAASNKLLSLAIQQSNVDVVKQLLDHGVDVHAAQKFLSPIEQACYCGDLPTFELVIRHGDRAYINRPGSQGKTLLHWAASGTVAGCLTKIQQLLKLGADIDSNVVDTNADTALTLASRSEREDIVALLVSEGADVLHRARDGWSLLHAAAVTGDLRYLQPLDQPHVPASYWRGTCEYPLVQIQRNISHTTQSVTATHLAAARGRTNFLRFMAQHDLPLDVNAVTGFPAVTPLDMASLGGHLDVVEFLAAVKANVNVRNAFRVLPIDLAARDGHIRIVKALLKSGSETPSRSFSPSFLLLMSKEREGVQDSGDSNAMSQFLFEQAVINGDLDRCKDMVRRGQSINAKLLTHSYTPLVRSVIQGQTAIVDWLVSLAVELRSPLLDRLHPSIRCIASLVTHHIPSSQTLSAIMSLALRQSVSWYEGVLSPLHVAILDNKVEALEVILKHIQENDHAYRYDPRCYLICSPFANAITESSSRPS